jgi:hydrogenase maturation protease
MSPHAAGILVLGYGNPGRMDDGLGPLFAEAVEKLGIDGVTVEANYQLTVEDAATIAEHDVVVFVDAAIEGPEPFTLERARPDSAMSFSTHSVTPAALLELTRELFGSDVEGYVLGIRGYEFDRFGEGLSLQAESNLNAALEFVIPALRRGPLRKHRSEAGERRYLAPSLVARSCDA